MEQKEFDAQLDAYLDGALSSEQEKAFLRQVEESPSLKVQLDCQAAIDEALRRCCTAPDGDELLRRSCEIGGSPTTKASQAPRTRGRPSARGRAFRPLAAAALIGITFIAIWRMWSFYQGSTSDGGLTGPRPLHVLYEDLRGRGFEPDWVCETEEQFVSTFEKKLGVRLALGPLPDDVSASGLLYAYSLSPRTIGLLARVRGEDVLVVVDRTTAGTAPSVPPESGLNLFRREIPGLVLYELTPLERPFLLDSFYRPPQVEP